MQAQIDLDSEDALLMTSSEVGDSSAKESVNLKNPSRSTLKAERSILFYLRFDSFCCNVLISACKCFVVA